MESLPLDQRLAHEGPFQEHWYRFVGGNFACGRTVLDVGAASGYGLEILSWAGALDVMGIDPLPLGPRVRQVPIEQIQSKSWDLVTALDVIEHVPDDAAFFAELVRVARWGIFLSTPNWHVWRAANPLHAREYRPEELLALLGGRSHQAWTSGNDLVVSFAPGGLSPDLVEPPNFGIFVRV